MSRKYSSPEDLCAFLIYNDTSVGDDEGPTVESVGQACVSDVIIPRNRLY